MSRTGLLSFVKRAAAASWQAEREGRDVVELIGAAASARMSRRRFLGASVGGLAAVSLAACGGDDSIPASDARVAVVGAGLAGLVCAYRLKQSGVNATVFEAANRTGGRTYTARGMLPGGVTTELGGEFINTTHETMLRLVEEFDLDLVDLAAEVKPGQAAQTWFLGGREVTVEDLARRFQPLARRMAAAAKQAEYSKGRFAQLDAMSITQWLEEQSDLDSVLRTALLESYRGEYGLEPDEQSVLNLLYLIDFDEPNLFRVVGESDERYRIRQGNDAVASALARGLSSQIRTGATLTSVSPGTSGRRLTVTSGGSGAEILAQRHVEVRAPGMRV